MIDWNNFNSICSLRNGFNGAIYKLSYPVYIMWRSDWFEYQMITQLVEHITRDSECPGSNPSLVLHYFCYTCINSIAIEFIPMINSTA